eukprot:1157473-Pelagomonas_calceolata.AAC.7
MPELPSDARFSHPAKLRLLSADEASVYVNSDFVVYVVYICLYVIAVCRLLALERAWSGGDLSMQAGMDFATGTLETWCLGLVKAG